MDLNISNRLTNVANMVTAGKRVTDIGTDHGYVPIYLVKNHLADYVIAMDINEGPIKRADENIKKFGLEKSIETRISNGFENILPGEAKAAVIAGMGGELMVRILKEGEKVVASLEEMVLSPHSEVYLIRKYLHEIHFKIIDEKMVFDEGKYYTIIKTVPGEEKNYMPEQYKYGKLLIDKKDGVLKEYLNYKLNKFENISENLKKQTTDKSRERLSEVCEEIEEIKGILKAF